MMKATTHKRRPRWFVEMQPPGTESWYTLRSFRDQDEAELQAKLATKRAPDAKVRVKREQI
jgi:hypothetical protein